MPKWMTVAFALFLSLQVFSTKGESVDDVINKYVNAMGGRERLASIKSLYYFGIAEEGGNKIIIKTHKEQDKLYRRDISSGSGKKFIVVTSSNGWNSDQNHENEFQSWTKEGVRNQQIDLDCAGPLVDYISKGHSAELLGKENINGTDCYKVRLTLKSGLIVHYYIDAKNWYIIREIRNGPGTNRFSTIDQKSEMTIDYADYRKNKEGYIFPFKELTGVSPIAAISYQAIEVNKPIDSRLYRPGY